MTRRLGVIGVLGLVAVAAAGGLSVYADRPYSPPKPSPTWGVFDAAQWRRLGARLAARGLDPSGMRVVTAMPRRDGTPFAIVAVRGRGGRICAVVVRGTSPAPAICRLRRPLLVFALADGSSTNVVGLAQPSVESVVASYTASGGRTFTQGTALLPAPHAWAFGGGYPGVPRFVARNRAGRVVYCASALRAVCGSSAQRRS